MACPYFEPLAPMASPGGRRFPLIDAWSGVCRAGGQSQEPPDARTLLEVCNCGYGRGVCSLFPCAGGPDAARFHVLEDGSVIWVLEKNWTPDEHGRIDRTALEEPPGGRLLVRQARACLESSRRRKLQFHGS